MKKKYLLLNGEDAKKIYFKAQCSLTRLKELGYDEYDFFDANINESILKEWTSEYIKEDEKYLKKLKAVFKMERLFKFTTLTYIDSDLAYNLFLKEKEIFFSSKKEDKQIENMKLNILFSTLIRLNYLENYEGLIVKFFNDHKQEKINELFSFLLENLIKCEEDFSIYYFYLYEINETYHLEEDDLLKKYSLSFPSLETYKEFLRSYNIAQTITNTTSLDLSLEFYNQIHNFIRKENISPFYLTPFLFLLLTRNPNFEYEGLLLDTFDLNDKKNFKMLLDDYLYIINKDHSSSYPFFQDLALFDAIYSCSLKDMLLEENKKYKEEDKLAQSPDMKIIWNAFCYLVGFNKEININKAYKILNKESKKKSDDLFQNSIDGFNIIFRKNFTPFLRQYVPLYIKMFDYILKTNNNI